MGTRSGTRVVAWRARISSGSVRSAGGAHSPWRDRGTSSRAWRPWAARSSGVCGVMGPSSSPAPCTDHRSRRPADRAPGRRRYGFCFRRRLPRAMTSRSTSTPEHGGDQDHPDQAGRGVEEDEVDLDGVRVPDDEGDQQDEAEAERRPGGRSPGCPACRPTGPPGRSGACAMPCSSAGRCCPVRQYRRARAVPGCRGRPDRSGRRVSASSSRVAWWAKSRIGPGMIPNTTVKATHRPMATAVSGGTGTGAPGLDVGRGGGVGQDLEAGRLVVAGESGRAAGRRHVGRHRRPVRRADSVRLVGDVAHRRRPARTSSRPGAGRRRRRPRPTAMATTARA